MPDEPSDPLAPVARLHDEVDARAEALARVHAGRLRCGRGCSGCCVDGLEVFEVEAERIRARHAELLRTEDPAPVGGCAFLDAEGGCRIYADRPYVCRTQGLPLRWAAPEGEHRDVCSLNDGDRVERGVPLLALPPEDCFELGPFEARLAALQAERQGVRPGAPLRRVALRSLFASTNHGRV